MKKTLLFTTKHWNILRMYYTSLYVSVSETFDEGCLQSTVSKSPHGVPLEAVQWILLSHMSSIYVWKEIYLFILHAQQYIVFTMTYSINKLLIRQTYMYLKSICIFSHVSDLGWICRGKLHSLNVRVSLPCFGLLDHIWPNQLQTLAHTVPSSCW